MPRTKGSTNKTTQTKRQIQEASKNKARRTRVVKPKAIVEINENYRILLDPTNYVLQRKLAIGEVAKADPVELEDDEEIQVIEEVPDADKWTLGGYFTPNTNGIVHLIDCCVHDMLTRKLENKRMTLPKYLSQFKQEYADMKKIIYSEMKM